MGPPTTGGRVRFPVAARIVAAMVLGGVVGWLLEAKAAPLGQIGTVVIDLIKALAAPLLLLAVLDAFLRTEVRARRGLRMVAISLVNAALALTIALVLSNVVRPGRFLADPRGEADATA